MVFPSTIHWKLSCKEKRSRLILVGIFHLALGPLFTQPGMIAFLSIIGFLTSLVSVIGRNLYATIVFTPVFGCIELMQSLAASGQIGAYPPPLFPVRGMAVISLLIVVWIDTVSAEKAIDRVRSRRTGPTFMR